ncbi:MAG: DNA-directed RNA polymerase subunit alpha [Candidatus Moranbacteria bacterium]|nr:DNA-directed RNA polymerase subunit alpha [Candidatus Moranbacteria bacterium]
MQRISLPHKPKYTAISESHGTFEIHGCYPGYGPTLGNALRRVLLSSLEGSAIRSVKIEGVTHEFSTLPGVMEDVVQIILNLKKLRFRMQGDDAIKLTLHAKGEGEVTAKSFKTTSDIEVVNLDQLIATITDKKTELTMEIEVDKGVGYIPVEQQERESKEIGVIAIDAIYTPIRRVNYDVENMRVGKRTDFDKVTLEIVTDGSVSPEEAFTKATTILVEQYSALLGVEAPEAIDTEAAHDIDSEAASIVLVAGLTGISAKVVKVLEENDIKTAHDLAKQTEETLASMTGITAKAIKDIKKALEAKGLSLK